MAEKKEKPAIFKIIDSINFDKDYDMVNEYTDHEYIPFVVNKSMSMGIDTILYSQELNRYPHLDKTLQYKYYLYAVRKKKRFNAWAKKLQASDDVSIISEYYGISLRQAREYEKLVSSDSIKAMKVYLNKGGIK